MNVALRFVGFYTSERRNWWVRVDQIRAIIEPNGQNDFGAVVLIDGKLITFGSADECSKLLNVLRRVEEG